MNRLRPLRRALAYLLPHWPLLLVSAASVAAAAGLILVPPLIVRHGIDRLIPAGRTGALGLAAAAIVAVVALRGAMAFGQRYLVELAAQRATRSLRNDLYAKLQSLSFSFFDHARTGQLMSRVVGDVETLRQFYGMGLLNLASNGLQALGVCAILLWLDWRLALVALSTFPLLLFATRQLAARVRPAQAEIQQQLAELTAAAQENVAGIRVVQAYAREDEEIARFDRLSRRYLEKNLIATRLSATYVPMMGFLSFFSLALVLWYGGSRVIGGALGLGSLVAFNSYLLFLNQPVRNVGGLVALGSRAAASAQRVCEVLDTPSAVTDRPGARPLPRARGEVRFEGVGFHYPGGPPVLEGIDLVARPGERIAIVGPTGSGKSTLALLIPRFYDVTAGRITIDGHDVRDVQLNSLRRQVAVVMQETFLFHASIRENIAYGRPGATDAEVEAAAKAAQIHEFIRALPKGYDTVVGERGVGLSGGQKQRVAIARALLLGAPVLILDESTSNVDAETEAQIHAAFDRVIAGRTSFIIAQRLSTLRGADRIVVLEGGRIAQLGSHAELLAQGGLYRRIVELQAGTQSNDADGRFPPALRGAN